MPLDQESEDYEIESEPEVLSYNTVEECAVLDDAHEDLPPAKETALIPYDPLRRYLMEISRYPLLTREEEQKLARAYLASADPKAAYVLVVSNLRLVVKIAMEYQRSWVANLMDLIQEGNVGLIQAVRKFDPLKGIRLSYYASFWIKAYILKYILDNWRLVKIGTTQAQRKLFYNLQKEKARLLAQGFQPDPKHLAEILGVRERDILEMNERLALPEKSLDAPAVDDYRSPLRDIIPAQSVPIDERLSDEEARARFHQKLAEFRETLEGKERDIFDHRLISEEPETLQQIGERYAITRERTRQLEARLIQKLRDFLSQDGSDLSDYHVGAR
jgi:RNA polymerase sigma-32 factor